MSADTKSVVLPPASVSAGELLVAGKDSVLPRLVDLI